MLPLIRTDVFLFTHRELSICIAVKEDLKCRRMYSPFPTVLILICWTVSLIWQYFSFQFVNLNLSFISKYRSRKSVNADHVSRHFKSTYFRCLILYQKLSISDSMFSVTKWEWIAIGFLNLPIFKFITFHFQQLVLSNANEFLIPYLFFKMWLKE